jgi:hypothetical protein
MVLSLISGWFITCLWIKFSGTHKQEFIIELKEKDRKIIQSIFLDYI